MYYKKMFASSFGGLIAVAFVASTQTVYADYEFESMPGLSVAAEYRMENILGENENKVISQRNELKIDIDYDRLIGGGGGLRVDFHATLLPFYDSVFDMNTSGMAGNSELQERWQTNLDGRGDKRDPLVRELYFDIATGNLDMRLGRQIVAWGKSDGVFMLDVINPFNFRNPFKFEEEDIKIPLWMANINLRVGSNSSVQFIWSPLYTRAQYPGYDVEETVGGVDALLNGAATGSELTRHAFGFKAIDYTNEFYQFEDWAFSGYQFDSNGDPVLLGAFPVNDKKPGRIITDSTAGLRWSSVIGDLSYTLNYLYTWSTFMGDFPNTGDFLTATSIDRRPGRMHVVGGSWDVPLNSLPGPFKGTIWRGETALFINDLFVNAVETDGDYFEPDKVTHHGLLMGFDQSFTFDLLPFISRTYLDPIWFVSVQYSQDYVLNSKREHEAYFDFAAGTPSWAEFGTPGYVERGKRDDFKSQMTLFILKDLLPGDVLHTEWFALYGLQSHDWWLRAKLRYEATDDLTVAIGYNKFIGGKYDPFGSFQDADHTFIEIRYSLF